MKDVLVQRSNCGERAMRIELTSRAWEARVITIIRRPQITYLSSETYDFFTIKPKLEYSSMSPCLCPLLWHNTGM